MITYLLESAGPGNHIGTFAGQIEHFSARTKSAGAKSKEKKNLFTNPGKKGTGYG